MAGDVLASWHDTATRQAIVDFVEAAVEAVPPAERIAVFDNDGTLWCEKPMPIELMFILRRLAAMAEEDPSLRGQQPWQAAYERDYQWLGDVITQHYAGDDTNVRVLMRGILAASAGMSVDDYGAAAGQFVGGEQHPTLARSLAACGFVPMKELLAYLQANEFVTYIASGGNRDFMRGFAETIYGIPPERIIGSSNELEYQDHDGGGSVVYQSQPDVFDDGPAKPVRIWSRIGRRPILAGGNSNGDVPMLRFAGRTDRPSLRLLVLHDDAEREFDYTAGAEHALEQARAHGWTVVSVKNDWLRVFADL